MKIEFDFNNEADVDAMRRLLGLSFQNITESPAGVTIKTDDPPIAPETSIPSPLYQEPPTPLAAPSDRDIHGMEWNAEIHSSPPAVNSDGSWRARRGKKDEYEAAIAAHKAAQSGQAGAYLAESASPAMPGPSQPAAPAPTTPPAPIDYMAMAKRFVGMMEAKKFETGFEKIYADLAVSYDDLEVNQTSIGSLWHYMDAIDQGMDHAGAVRHAMGSI